MATSAEDMEAALQETDAARGDEEREEELKRLKLQRGRKAAAVTRACNTAETRLSQCPDPQEVKKRLETLNTALEAFMTANDTYVAIIKDTNERSEAEQLATQVTAKHAAMTKRLKDAMKAPSEAAPSVQTVSRVSGSQASRGSRMSSASKNAEIAAELKALELRQLRARKERETELRRAKQDREAELRRAKQDQEAELRRARQQQEDELKRQEDHMQLTAVEEELERARLKARLLREAESELTWERRHDFHDEDGEETELQHPTMTIPVQPAEEQAVLRHVGEQHRPTYIPEAAALGPVEPRRPSPGGRNSADWIRELGSDRHVAPQGIGPSAFTKSIPRLSLPTFRGNAREWPRWIGLFKALVHDQPSLTDAERMAHLQNAVAGPASQAIDGMLYDGALYQEALRTLQERFGREEDITQAHLRSIFTAVPPTLTDLPAMERFCSVVCNGVTVLRSLGYVSDLASSENLRRVVEKLPIELRRTWGGEVFRLRPDRPTLETFSEWLKVQTSILSYAAIQTVDSDRKHAASRTKEDMATVRKSAFVTRATHTGEMGARKACVACNEEHWLAECPAFEAKNPSARMEIVRAGGLCFSCLRKGHWSRECRSTKRCSVENCNSTHHRLLHGVNRRSGATKDASKSAGAGSAPFVAASLKDETDTLLQVVSVRVHGETGSKDVLALLDTGAQTSLCCEDVLRELSISGDRRQLCIQHVEGSGTQKSSERVTVTVSALGGDAKEGRIGLSEVWSVPSLNVRAPKVDHRQLKHFDHLRGLKFPQYDGGEVKLLLGGNVLEAVLQQEARVGRSDQPAAVRTEFGWSLVGSVSAMVPSNKRQVMLLRRDARQVSRAASRAPCRVERSAALSASASISCCSRAARPESRSAAGRRSSRTSRCSAARSASHCSVRWLAAATAASNSGDRGAMQRCSSSNGCSLTSPSSSSALRRGRRDAGGSGTGGGMSTGARATCRGRCGSRPLRLTGRTSRCGPATCSRTRLQLRKKVGDPSVPGAVCDRCWSADLDETALRGGTTGWRWRHRRPERQCLRVRPPAPANLSRC